MVRRPSARRAAIPCVLPLALMLGCVPEEALLPPVGRVIPDGIDNSAFPRDFMWGAASSSHQAEGNDVDSDWWQWEQQPGKIKTGETSGLAADHWNRFKEDFDGLVAINLDTYRLSISWARLYPRAGMSEPDPDAVAHYDAVFAALRARHIRPIVALHHFAMPNWLTQADRWGSGAAIGDFQAFARFCAERWGGEVDWWITLNEPEIFALHGWLNRVFPPGKSDLWLALQVLANLMKAHAEAYHLIKEVDTLDADGDGLAAQVGVAKLIVPFEPYSAWNPVEQLGTAAMGAFSNGAWFAADRTGVLDLALPFGPRWTEDFPLFRGTMDFVGVNYYSRQLFRLDPLFGLVPAQHPLGIRDDLGHEIYPQGLYKALEFCALSGLPLMVTENGIADASDELRGTYIRSHLTELSRFMHDRPDVRVLGYVYWALTDNFEWENGFRPRFGLYAVDYATRARSLRPSAADFGAIIATIKAQN